MNELIVIASGKGGTGKTTFTSHLGAALAAAGELVCVVDTDEGFRNLDIAMGLESSIVYDYSDYISGNKNLDDIIIKSSTQENLYFIAAPQTTQILRYDAEKAEEFWSSLKNRFSFVIADAPAGMGQGFGFAAGCADRAIIVSLAEASALRDADRIISELETLGITEMSLVINRMEAELVSNGILMNIDDCIDMLGIPLLGVIPYDIAVAKSVSDGSPLIEPSGFGAGTAFYNIAQRLLGKNVKLMKFNNRIKKGFKDKLKGLFSKS